MSVYSDLENRVLNLVNSETSISAIEWAKEAQSIKNTARRLFAEGRISLDEKCRLIKMLMEGEDEQ